MKPVSIATQIRISLSSHRMQLRGELVGKLSFHSLVNDPHTYNGIGNRIGARNSVRDTPSGGRTHTKRYSKSNSKKNKGRLH